MQLQLRTRALDLSAPVVMGVINVTPDSFSDGGCFANPEQAVARALEMAGEGAALLDVGGESTRPGATPVGVREELARVIPVIEALVAGGAPAVSNDTTKPEVMVAAASAGAELINDVKALAEPGGVAWQIFDQQVAGQLRDEYRIREVSSVKADTLEELGRKMEGMNAEAFLRNVAEYNAAVETSVPFNPNVKDGRATTGLRIDKTNWAHRLDEGPFEAYQTTCGITFTFGGLRIDAEGAVLDTEEKPIRGLYAAGELVGGLFYFNYPGGTGLMSGAVFGKIAGASAGQAAVGNS
jgi:succinate dehydrogenase/fumarate reductase flavoprotein subunit